MYSQAQDSNGESFYCSYFYFLGQLTRTYLLWRIYVIGKVKREVENCRKKRFGKMVMSLFLHSGNQFRCSFCISLLPDPTGSYVQNSLELCGSMANKNMGCSVTFDLQINNGYFFFLLYVPKKTLFVYLKFRFNWMSCILSGNPTLRDSHYR